MSPQRAQEFSNRLAEAMDAIYDLRLACDDLQYAYLLDVAEDALKRLHNKTKEDE